MASESDAGEIGASMRAASSLPAYVRACPQYGTIVCTEHRTAYTLKNIATHLSQAHKVGKHVRELLLRQFEVDDVAHTVSEPAHGSAPIPGLQVYDGWQCNVNDCITLSQSLKVIADHCRVKHGLTSKLQREKNDAVVAVKLQRWFANSNKYWVIGTHHHSRPQSRASSPHSLPTRTYQSSPLLTSLDHVPRPRRNVLDLLSQEVHDEEQARRRSFHQVEHPSESTPWERESGYEQHLVDIDRDLLRPLLRVPLRVHDAPALYYITASVSRVLLTSYKQVRHLHRVHAMRLNSFEVNRKSNDPFKVLQNAQSFERYSRLFQRLVCYVYRSFHEEPFERALFVMSPQQERMLEVLDDVVITLRAHLEDSRASSPEPLHDTREQLEAQVDQATLNFLVALVLHATSDPFDSGVMSYCAASAWSGPSSTFRSVTEATSTLSHLIYCCQLILLAEARRTVRDDHSLLQAITVLSNRWGNNDAFGPLGDMLRLRTYGLTIGKHNVGMAQVRWRSDNETLMYRDITYRVQDLAREIQFCLDRATSILHRDLCFDLSNVPHFRLDALEDNWDNTVPGASFLTDARNADQLGDHRDWINHQLVAHPPLYHLVVQDTEEQDGFPPRVRSEFAVEYERSVQQFLAHLSLLIHKGSGQPGRGTEFVGLRWRNLLRGNVQRNLFVHDGHLLFLLTYHKTQSQSHASRYPVRFLLPEVAQLLVQYLVLVQPFRATLSRGCAIPAQASEYLWHNGHALWDVTHFSQIQRDLAEQAHGVAVNIRSWRQIAVAIAIKRFHGRAYLADLDVPSDETDDLQGQSLLESWGGAMPDVFHHQAAHTPRTGNRAYGGTVNFQDGLTDAGLQEYLRASQMWHQLCRPDLPRAPLGHRRQASSQPTSRGSQTPLRRRLSLRQRGRRYARRWGSEQVQAALGQLFPQVDAVRFRSVQQEQLIDGIVTGHSEVVGVLGTGAGKSLAFLLPACLPEAGTTVVVVPLVALKADMTRRCDEVGLTYAVWSATTAPERLLGTPLLFVSVEQSVGQRFRTFLGQLDATSALDRIVFDEAHLILTASSYRPKMGLLKYLRQLSCQVVFLTATLPPTMQAQFDHRLLLRQPYLVRSRSFRSDLVYRIRHSRDADLVAYTATRVQSMVQTYHAEPAARILVYTQTRADADALAASLSCPVYYSDSGDVATKQEAMTLWRRGTSRVLVATSAFGLGVDFPSVRQVVHMGVPADLIEFAQEVGRLSRDGQGGFSRVFLPRRWTCPDLPSVVDQRRSSVASMAMLTYLGDNRCLSAVLSRFLDGPENVQYCPPGRPDHACSKCQQFGFFHPDREADHTRWWDPRTGHGEDSEGSDHAGGGREGDEVPVPSGSLSTGPQRLRDHIRQQAHARQRYREGLDLLRGRCMLCMVLNFEQVPPAEQMHELRSCPDIHRGAFFRAKRAAIERGHSRGGWMPPFVACFRCGQPQEICAVADLSTSSECHYRDLIFPATWALTQRDRCWGRTLGDLSGQPSRIWQDENRYMDWLGSPGELHGMRASEGARLMDRIMRLELGEVFEEAG